MAAVMKWGETIQVFIELGFPVEPFTLDSATLGVLDTNFIDGTLIGDDVAEFVQNISISRGRSDQLQTFNAGTASITLLNNDRRFDPINSSSPYWNPTTNTSGVTPRRKVTIISNGVTIFVGRITDIDVVYSPHQTVSTYDNSTVTFSVADDFVLLANTSTSAVITPTAQLSGARVTAILDLPEVNFPTTRSIATGVATLGGGATYDIGVDTNILSYLQTVALSEQGYFFVARTGVITFTDRVAAAFASISLGFSDQSFTFDLRYQGLSVVYGQELLYNKIIVSNVGGINQVANDSASQTEFGISTLNLSGLLLNSDANALVLANDLLSKYKQPEYRFDLLRSAYNVCDNSQQISLASLEISQVIQITKSYPVGTPSTVVQLMSIESVKHTITGSNHVVEFGLAPANVVYQLILDDITFGVLDSTNAVA